ncbi:50S ribosomal protein L24 [Candidatus Daviesbacteria bacterium]|nr:50S ribosomal protein L24 [Candidatus Daviesbacteria bacterium]
MSKKLKKGDSISILLGKDRGKTGQVEKVLSKEDKVFIAGLNLYKRHVKKQGQIEGGIIEILKPMNISNVGLICPNCKKVTRVGFEIDKDGKKRVCRKCGKAI